MTGTTADRPGIADCYLEVHGRLDELVRSLPPEALATPVPACPGWDVRDVLSHLAGIVEWFREGRLTGPPTDDDTAAQVAELADVPPIELLDRWAAHAVEFATAADGFGVWPAAIDIACHEQDIRGALGRPGARDSRAVRCVAGVLLRSLDPAVPVRVETESGTVDVGEGEPVLTLRTTDFEVLRWRLGRRSRAQMAAMDWTGDPTPVLDELHTFGPAAADVVE